MKKLLFLTPLLVALCGCAGVPETYIKLPGGGLLKSPKQIELTNLVVTANTNGKFNVKIDSLTSKNDPDVIAQVGLAQAKMLEQVSAMMQQFTEQMKKAGEMYMKSQTGGLAP
jgi:hypothetical protein